MNRLSQSQISSGWQDFFFISKKNLQRLIRRQSSILKLKSRKGKKESLLFLCKKDVKVIFSH